MTANAHGLIGAILPLLLVLIGGCRIGASPDRARREPWNHEVRLEGSGGFDAYLVHRGDVGIWTVECLEVLERYGCPEIVALDDRGRCTILVSYSGKWTPRDVLEDGKWLGGVALGDVDPRRSGRELYVGGKRGNLYQVCPLPQGGFDANVIAYLPGKEIHTLAVADLDSTQPRSELYAFTRPGAVYRLEPHDGAGKSFACRLVRELPGRVRDAVVIPGRGAPAMAATVSRSGEVALWSVDSGELVRTVVYRTGMGLGRIAARPTAPGDPVVLYATADDGRILRLGRGEDGTFSAEVIYAGPQGPRGIAAGRFDEDPHRETVAVFGYSRKVQLLTRTEVGWEAETIFEDIDKGHWLGCGELDGRNTTDELVASGYGKRVVLLSRPPGYGLDLPPTARRAVARDP